MWPARASRETAGAWVVARPPQIGARKVGWAIRYNGSSHALPWTKHAFAAVWASHTQSLTMAGAKKIVARRAQ
jgi:hypothetical protein